MFYAGLFSKDWTTYTFFSYLVMSRKEHNKVGRWANLSQVVNNPACNARDQGLSLGKNNFFSFL